MCLFRNFLGLCRSRFYSFAKPFGLAFYILLFSPFFAPNTASAEPFSGNASSISLETISAVLSDFAAEAVIHIQAALERTTMDEYLFEFAKSDTRAAGAAFDSLLADFETPGSSGFSSNDALASRLLPDLRSSKSYFVSKLSSIGGASMPPKKTRLGRSNSISQRWSSERLSENHLLRRRSDLFERF